MRRGWLVAVLALALVPGGFGGAGLAQSGKVTQAQQGAANKQALLDINTASADELKTLPGVGDAYAQRIIKGRPYQNKTQLTTRGVLPQGTYDKIKAMIVAKKSS